MSFSSRGYGRLYVAAGSTAQTLHATPGTFVKVAAWATAGRAYGTTPTASTTDSISLAGSTAEVADVRWSISFTVGAAGLFRVAPYAADAALTGAEQRITCATTTTYTLSGSVLYTPSAASEVLDLRAASDLVSPAITIIDGWLEFRQ